MAGAVATHRDILRRLSTEEKRQLTARSDVCGLIQLGGHLATIGVCLFLSMTGEGPLAVKFEGIKTLPQETAAQARARLAEQERMTAAAASAKRAR